MDFDNLQIQISTSAGDAEKQIGNLAKKLGNLQTAIDKLNPAPLQQVATSISSLATSMQALKNSGVDSRTFNTLARNINNLSNANVGNLTALGTALTNLNTSLNGLTGNANLEGLRSITSAVGTLGGVKVQRAITNIPLLGTALNELFTTLSRSPQVSQNLIDMTNALARLSQSMRTTTTQATASVKSSSGLFSGLRNVVTSIVGATKNVGSGFVSLATKMKPAEKQTVSLASAFGKLYANYFLVLRAIGLLKKSVTGAMDYVEILNYYDKTMERVAENITTDEWKNAGYKSADAYTDALNERLTRASEDLSGMKMTRNGMLERTGLTNLGLDQNMVINYLAQFTQMASSMGVASQEATTLSEVLVKIGGDLASVRNLDFKDVFNKMSSGLVGMSRTWDIFGTNIRNANLQQELYRHGINATVSSLSQADKALLRTVILLETNKYAWGDLSETIESPSNRLRALKASFSMLGRAIGNVFLPIVNATLPYITALSNALATLFTWVQKLLGFEAMDISAFTGGGEAEDVMSSILDDAEDTSDALGEAGKNAKKMKDNLIGIDKLNIINDKNDSSNSQADKVKTTGAIKDLFNKTAEDYLTAWQKAFEATDTQAKTLTEKLENTFKNKQFTQLGGYVSDSITTALDKIPWKKVYSAASGFGQGLAQFLNGLIKPKLFKAVARTIAGALNTELNAVFAFGATFDFENFGKSISEGINTFFTTYDFSLLKATLGLWGNSIATLIKATLDNIKWDNIYTAFSKVGNGMAQFLNGLFTKDTFKSVGTTVANLLNTALSWAVGFASNFNFGSFGEAIATGINEVFRNFKFSKLDTAMTKWGKGIGKTITGLLNNLDWDNIVDGITKLGTALAKFINNAFTPESVGSIGKSLAGIINGIVGFVYGAGKELDAKQLGVSLGTGINEFVENLDTKKMADTVDEWVKNIAQALTNAVMTIKWDEVFKSLFDFFSNLDIETLVITFGTIKLLGLGGAIFSIAGYAGGALMTFAGALLGFLPTLLAGAVLGLTVASIVFDIDDAVEFSENVYNSAKGAAKSLIDGLFGEGTTDELKDWYDKKLKKYVDKVMGWLDDVFTTNCSDWYAEEMKGLWDSSMTAFEEGDFDKGSKKLVQAIIDGILAAITFLGESLLNIGYTIYAAIFGLSDEEVDEVLQNGVVQTMIDEWGTVIENVKNSFMNIGKSILDYIFNIDPGAWVSGLVDDILGSLEDALSVVGVNIDINGDGHIGSFATGGFPEDGLFMANHNELVGKFSNGKTAVVNNAQIVEGVSQGVAQAVASVMGSGTQTVIVPVNIDGKEVTRIVNNQNDKTGNNIFGNENGYVYG